MQLTSNIFQNTFNLFDLAGFPIKPFVSSLWAILLSFSGGYVHQSKNRWPCVHKVTVLVSLASAKTVAQEKHVWEVGRCIVYKYILGLFPFLSFLGWWGYLLFPIFSKEWKWAKNYYFVFVVCFCCRLKSAHHTNGLSIICFEFRCWEFSIPDHIHTILHWSNFVKATSGLI